MEFDSQVIIYISSVILALGAWLLSISRKSGIFQEQIEARFKMMEVRVDTNSKALSFAKDEICQEVKSIRRMLMTPEGNARFITWDSHYSECARNSVGLSKDVNNLGSAVRELALEMKATNTRIAALELSLARLEEHR